MQIQRDILEKAGISRVEIQHLEASWGTYQTAAAQPVHQAPHIVCTGIYNAGKSTLLNALCGEEKFPTGDTPTTKEVAQAEFGGAVYIDTPGLNAMDEDDRETQAAYESADFILFVANAQNGGISAAEAKWLQKLKARYGSLHQRLIYVLTHCTQVEPEQLSEILKKIVGDFKKAVEFEPEHIFCVDSITYQNGIGQNEPLLTEGSGILQLKSCLAERIAGAEKTLREARDAELAANWRDLIQQLEYRKDFCCQKIQELSVQKQSADIEKLFATTKKKLKDTLSDSVYFFGILVLETDHKTYYEGKNLGDLKRSASEYVKNYARKALSEAKRETESVLERAEKDYGNVGINSAYFKKCNEVNRILEELQVALTQLGIHLESYQEVQVQPDDVSSLSSELTEYKNGSSYWSANKYFDVFENRIEESKDEYGYEATGLFGITRWMPKYTVYTIYANNEIATEIRETFQRNNDDAKDWIDRYYWQPFLKELSAKATERLSEMRQTAETIALETSQTAEKPYQTALEHLDTLQKEVSQ